MTISNTRYMNFGFLLGLFVNLCDSLLLLFSAVNVLIIFYLSKNYMFIVEKSFILPSFYGESYCDFLVSGSLFKFFILVHYSSFIIQGSHLYFLLIKLYIFREKELIFRITIFQQVRRIHEI